jgi:hypothetical protein
MANPGVFIEKDIHPPKIEQQIGELVSKDFPSLVREIASRGHVVDESALAEMYVHVELAEDVRNALKTRERREERSAPVPPTRTSAFPGRSALGE